MPPAADLSPLSRLAVGRAVIPRLEAVVAISATAVIVPTCAVISDAIISAMAGPIAAILAGMPASLVVATPVIATPTTSVVARPVVPSAAPAAVIAAPCGGR